jgi:uncharacterized membrane protein YgdD (TMEM256/DUF423 family)
MYKTILSTGSILAGLAVIAGAFAAHGLRGYLPESALSIWQTAVKYQMYHSLALLLVAILMRLQESISYWLYISAIAFLIGILLFSGSLYSLSLTNIHWLGIITPIGGVVFIIGWLCLAIYPWQD